MEPVTTAPHALFDIKRVNTVLAAVASGIVGTCFGHPLDLIKVRLQALSNTNQYKGSWDCLTQSLKNDGVPGLFRGIAPPLIGSTILNVISFSSYSILNDFQLDYKRRHRDPSEPGVAKLHNFNYGLSGFGVGIFCAPAVCPIEVVKVRMQLDRKEASKGVVNNAESTPSRRYKGSWDCFKQVLKSEGIRGFYTGFSYTTIRDVSYSSTYFFVYEPLKQFLVSNLYGKDARRLRKNDSSSKDDVAAREKKEKFPLLPVILSGGTSGALAWTVALPFDCVKTQMQKPPDNNTFYYNNIKNNVNNVNNNSSNNNNNNNTKKRVSAWAVVKTQYAYGGIQSFYAGWIPTILRAFAVSGVRFLVYESSIYWLNRLWQKKFL